MSMRHGAWIALLTALLVAMLASSCTRDRTQIMLRIRTDMRQGPSGELGSIRVQVTSEGAAEPDLDDVYELGGSTTLPATLALVPTAQREGLVEIEVEARDPSGAVMFTRRAAARYVPERTLLLDLVLASRCREAGAQACPQEQSCGLAGCEPILMPELPDYLEGLDGSLPTHPDAGIDACTAMCDGTCVDTTTNVSHCGACENACTAPTGATPTCSASECAFECEAGLHACDEACVSSTSLETCGTSCTPCAGTTDGVATCDGTSCGFMCNPGFRRTSTGCVPGPNVDPPRPIAPASFGRVTSLRPTFRWAPSAGTDGALVQVCEDRECTNVLASREAEGGATSVRLDRELIVPASGSRRLYFRLFGRSEDATGASPSATWSFVLPARDAGTDTSFGAALDFNGDGLSDLAVGSQADRVQLYTGTATGLAAVATPLTQAAGSEFGVSVASAGDVDGDGYGDLVLGAPGIRRAYIYRGSAGGISTTPITLVGATGSEFGRAVAGAGDVNRDGYADVLVGAPGTGEALLYFGGPTIDAAADVTYSGPTLSRFGAALAALDGDADGYGDVAIGAPAEGKAYVFRGAATLSAAIASTSASATLTGSPIEEFGASLAGALDVDGDGRSDLLVGSPGAASGAPGVRLYLGASGGVATTEARAWAFPGAGSTSDFGAALHAAGDVNRDGYDDFLVGAPGVASAYIFRGRAPDGEDTPAATYSIGLSSRLGAAVTSTGDVNGDGYDDSVIGAPGQQSATLYLHTATGLASSGASLPSTAAGFGAALAALCLPGPLTEEERT